MAVTASRTWRDGALIDDAVDRGELLAALADPDTLVWVDLLNPSKESLTELFTDLGLPPTAVEDALAPHERTKLTRHDQYSFLTIYAAAGPDGSEPTPSRISALALPHALVTVRLDDLVPMGDVVARWQAGPTELRRSVAGLLHGLLDAVVDGHLDALDAYDAQVDALEADLFGERGDAPTFARRIYEARVAISGYRRMILPVREVVAGLYRHGAVNDELRPWFDDLYDHTLRAAEWTDSLREIVTSLFETHLSLQDARLNTIMKKLAAWAAIIAVPTAITGWFGQNVPYFGFGQAAGVWLSLGMIVVAAGALYAVFRKLDWV